MARRKQLEVDNATIDRAIELLEQDNPITKKDACQILKIRYNTQRLDRIVKERKDQIAFEKRMRAEKRGKPADRAEKISFIREYLGGESINSIAKDNYRTPGFVKKVLKDANIPIRSLNSDYRTPPLIPEEALKADYKEGDLVFAARYNQVARVVNFKQKHPVHGNVFSIYLLKSNKRAYQPWYELADLSDVLNSLDISENQIYL